MNHTRLEAIVFDFDGTLATLEIDFPLMKKRVSAMAGAMLEKEIEAFEIPVLEWLARKRDEVAETDRDLALELHTRGRLIITAMELDAARQGRLFEQTRPILEKLASAGVRTGIITRNCTPAVRAVFPDISECCPVFLPREDVDNVKPHPEHLTRALDALGADPRKSLMVGDHHLDIQTAKNAGTLSGAVASGNMSLEELETMNPDFAARDIEALMGVLEERGLL